MAALGAATVRWVQVFLTLLLCLSQVLLSASGTNRRSYYDTLNLEPTATDRQIKKSFRQLAIKYHPDKNKSTDAEKTFREIAEAYQVLSNKEKRRQYDTVGHEAFVDDEDASINPEDKYESDFDFNFADLFNDFDHNPFEEDPNIHWSFHQEFVMDDSSHDHYTFSDDGFRFYFGDEDEEDQFY